MEWNVFQAKVQDQYLSNVTPATLLGELNQCGQREGEPILNYLDRMEELQGHLVALQCITESAAAVTILSHLSDAWKMANPQAVKDMFQKGGNMESIRSVIGEQRRFGILRDPVGTPREEP
jgi:hypothetical protein